jgi:nicotinate-nucleotide pyrophosphorylase (carboxylating)
MDWKSRRVTALLEAALIEDKAAHDITTALTIDPALRATATIVAKQACVVSGIGSIAAFLTLFNKLASRSSRFEVISHPEIFDGVRVKKGQAIAVIRGNAASILSTERVILNLMQRMSGIATLTSEYVRAIASVKLPSKSAIKTRILDTRKTIPGLRALDKYAVCCGGGVNHRLDLQDGILIKNNHIALGGGLPLALEHALAGRKPGQVVQVEVRSALELQQAIAGSAEAILLDNAHPQSPAQGDHRGLGQHEPQDCPRICQDRRRLYLGRCAHPLRHGGRPEHEDRRRNIVSTTLSSGLDRRTIKFSLFPQKCSGFLLRIFVPAVCRRGGYLWERLRNAARDVTQPEGHLLEAKDSSSSTSTKAPLYLSERSHKHCK